MPEHRRFKLTIIYWVNGLFHSPILFKDETICFLRANTKPETVKINFQLSDRSTASSKASHYNRNEFKIRGGSI
ncbi:hypothetical protein [Halalkalibacter alkaliphilus]|uniref:Uncharacterized protein n=1 Tax=Halalkalibacter alkaliphilus TaxID=2917993 RepID=A0A9X2CVT7_9BACI|nr:hypothetical protein [Halalkalibacter alkaliphilus]MCL7749220.1 hypothetical protein [Halalkalibacter alkaliphilus]